MVLQSNAVSAAPTVKGPTQLSKPYRESFWQWKPTSFEQAEQCEREMLAILPLPFKKSKVDVGGIEINTIVMGVGPPIVLVHGFGAGIGFWVANFAEFAAHFTVYAFDLPGFGLSDRPPFKGDSVRDAEAYFLTVIDGWVRAMQLDNFVLLGHSLGGYLSTLYALANPKRIIRLILADPWGIPGKDEVKKQLSFRRKLLCRVVCQFNPLSVVRSSGPFGPDIVTKFRQDIAQKFQGTCPNPQLVLDYVYHTNAREPTGEEAFLTMVDSRALARDPLGSRMRDLDPSINVELLYGSKSMWGIESGKTVAEQLGSRATFHIVPDAGHHIYIDNPKVFNAIVLGTATQRESAAPGTEAAAPAR